MTIDPCQTCNDVGWYFDTTRTAEACKFGCQHGLDGCMCEGEPEFCDCPAGVDLEERIASSLEEGDDE